MDLSELRKLVRVMLQAELTEIEIDDSNRGLRVHLKRSSVQSGEGGGMGPVVQLMPSQAPAAPVSAVAGAVRDLAPEEAPPGTEVFASPMVGTFYRASSPDSEPFVSVGSAVDEESVVCIIEAMKVMNEIRAERRGTVVEVLVENGEPVEFGQPLFLLKRA